MIDISICMMNSLVCMLPVMQSIQVHGYSKITNACDGQLGANKGETASVHTCKGLQRCYNKHSRSNLRCKSPYHQVSISCSYVYVCERACVFPSLFCNAARSIPQSGSNRVAGEEEGKLTDRLRHNQYIIHLLSESRDLQLVFIVL